MESLFVSGTDTGVGKTYVAAGIAAELRAVGADVGVMKPFAAGAPRSKGFRSGDAELLARAARVSDPEDLVNPQFFPVPASPYGAGRRLGAAPDVELVLSCYAKLAGMHEAVIVEGIGGVMTPIRRDYFAADLARDMGIPAILVVSCKIGAVNHAVLAAGACRDRGVRIKGLVINCAEEGYDPGELAGDLRDLLGARVLGAVPRSGGEWMAPGSIDFGAPG